MLATSTKLTTFGMSLLLIFGSLFLSDLAIPVSAQEKSNLEINLRDQNGDVVASWTAVIKREIDQLRKEKVARMVLRELDSKTWPLDDTN